MRLSPAQFNQPLDYSQGAIKNQIVHTMWAEEVWLSRIINQPAPDYKPDDFSDRAAIRAAWDVVEARLRQTVTELGEDGLQRQVGYQNSTGTGFDQTVAQILLHIVNHGTDHRAQTLAMMHTLGAETIEQDLIYFYRG